MKHSFLFQRGGIWFDFVWQKLFKFYTKSMG